MCDPIDGSPSGSALPGILQARTLEWVAISFSSACKWKVKVKSLSCVQLSVTPWTAAYQAPPSMGFSRQEYWSGVPLPSPMALAVTKYLVSLNYMLVFVAEFLCQLGCFCSPPFGEGLEEARYSAADCTLFSRRGRLASSQNTLVPRLQGLGIFCVSSATPPYP